MPSKPKERAYGPLPGLSGVPEDFSIPRSNCWAELQRTQRQEVEPHVAGEPNIRVSSGCNQVDQRTEFFPQNGKEGIHVIGTASLPNMSERKNGATSASVSTQARGLLASRPNPDMTRRQRMGSRGTGLIQFQHMVNTWAALAPADFRGPRPA